MSGITLEFFGESGDLAVRLQPAIAIGSEIPAQLIEFLNKLPQFGIHPWNHSFADRLVGDGLCLGPFEKVTEGLQMFGQGADR